MEFPSRFNLSFIVALLALLLSETRVSQIRLWESTGTSSTIHAAEYLNKAANDASAVPLTELHLTEALERITRTSSRKVLGQKFLISRGMRTGFESEIHIEGLGLAMALETGRIYMPPRVRVLTGALTRSGSVTTSLTRIAPLTQEMRKQKAYNLQHYPISKGRIRMFKVKESKNQGCETKVIDKKAIHSATETYRNEAYLSVLEAIHIGPYFKIVYTMVQDLVDKLPIADRLKHYWWRAVAAEFLLREQGHTTTRWTAYSWPG